MSELLAIPYPTNSQDISDHLRNFFFLTPTVSQPVSARSIDPTLSLEDLIINRNKELFEKIKTYNSGWDGYQGQEFSSALIDLIKAAVNSANFPPKVFPGGSGNIQLEYYTDENNNTEMEIEGELIHVLNTEEGKETPSEHPITELNNLIARYGKPQHSTRN